MGRIWGTMRGQAYSRLRDKYVRLTDSLELMSRYYFHTRAYQATKRLSRLIIVGLGRFVKPGRNTRQMNTTEQRTTDEHG